MEEKRVKREDSRRLEKKDRKDSVKKEDSKRLEKEKEKRRKIEKRIYDCEVGGSGYIHTHTCPTNSIVMPWCL